MPMTTAAAHALALLIFQNTDYENVGDAGGLRGSVTPGVFYVSLHTALPGLTGDQTTSEATYTGYGNRPSVARSAAGFTVGTGGAVSNAAAVTFPACTAGTNVITAAGLGSAQTGAGTLMSYGSITVPAEGLNVSVGITPNFPIGALTATVS